MFSRRTCFCIGVVAFQKLCCNMCLVATKPQRSPRFEVLLAHVFLFGLAIPPRLCRTTHCCRVCNLPLQSCVALSGVLTVRFASPALPRKSICGSSQVLYSVLHQCPFASPDRVSGARVGVVLVRALISTVEASFFIRPRLGYRSNIR